MTVNISIEKMLPHIVFQMHDRAIIPGKLSLVIPDKILCWKQEENGYRQSKWITLMDQFNIINVYKVSCKYFSLDL